MRATVSLLGLYNYDPTVLDGLTLPENFLSGDIDILKNNLLMETAELELLYTDPNFLKFAITNWCNKNRPTWKWLLDTQHYEYNPIWNVDYHQSDRTDTTDKNVGTSTNTNNFTRALNESEDTIDRMGYASQMAHNFNSELEHGYNSQLEHGYNSELEKAYNSNLEHEFDSSLEHGYNSTLAKTYAGTAKEEHSGDTDTETKNHVIEKSGSETTEHSVSAYNQSNAYHPESKDQHSFNNYKDTENGHVIFDDNITIDNTTNYTDTDVHTGADTDTHDGKDTDKHTGADTDTHSGADTDTHSGADTDSHTGADTDVHSGADTRTIDRDLSQTGGTTTTDSGRTTSDTDTNVKYEKYLRGNYGQTTTQDMINQEQELAKKNIFDYIICDFKKRFCLMVY